MSFTESFTSFTYRREDSLPGEASCHPRLWGVTVTFLCNHYSGELQRDGIILKVYTLWVSGFTRVRVANLSR